jgi:coenzyme F420-dependent glucose-6-phosphate dehydrogenase
LPSYTYTPSHNCSSSRDSRRDDARTVFLGVGTGENLNEHILGDRWPAYAIRAEMLEEAIQVIRLLRQGRMQSYYGKYYTVENARLYTLPDVLPPIMIAAAGPKSAEIAGRVGDGLINTAPEARLVQTFEKNGGKQRPKYGKVTVCWAESTAKAREIAYKYWSTAGLKGDLSQELPTQTHFERAAQIVSEEQVAEALICSNNPEDHLKGIQEFIDAGFDHVYVHQIGPDQEGFLNCIRNLSCLHLYHLSTSQKKYDFRVRKSP